MPHGIRANLPQFILLVVVNAFVGAMVGLERTVLPALAVERYHLVASTAILSFIVAFGSAKALTNYVAGVASDRVGRKRVLVVGWIVAVPVPLLLMWAPTWNWVIVANILLGVSQGLTWSTTVVMKIDLVGSKRRGLAMGLNEFAGYLAVGLSALAAGIVAENYGLSPEPFYLGIGYVVIGLALSVFVVRETRGFVELEEVDAINQSAQPSQSKSSLQPRESRPSQGEIFRRTTISDRNLSASVQAGFVNNLNDGMAWGLFPLLYASAGMNIGTIGWLVAAYPITWGIAQLVTGAASDRVGRKPLIVCGMLVQAVALASTPFASSAVAFATAAVALGLGTALVYPTLLAAIGDASAPQWRASAVGIYRFWRDAGYPVGALLAAAIADRLGIEIAIIVVAAITALSGLVVALRMTGGPASSLPGDTQHQAP
ncbi:MAG: MFS transporter [bacterium]|nr:MFS transporter [Candidatus Kapabacteria bacterium]